MVAPRLLNQPVSVVDAAHAVMLAVVLLACMGVSLRLHSCAAGSSSSGLPCRGPWRNTGPWPRAMR
jgi:hypothetical protein